MITQRQNKTQATKQRIIDAALRLFAEQGVDATTTRHIASAAEIAEGTIYRHFESKDALAKELFEGAFVPFSKALTELSVSGGSTIEKIRATVRHFYSAFDADPARWAYIMTYQRGPWSKVDGRTMTPVKLMHRLLNESVATGEFQIKNPALTTQIVMGIIEHPALGIIYQELKGPLAGAENEVVSAIENVLRS